MSASDNFITRPVLTVVCSLLIVFAGLIAIPLLPVENLPDIAPPTVRVTARYNGADALSVEQGVTAVLEQQINGVQNMEFISSNSSADGTSAITVSFASGTDGDINQVNVQNRVALAQPQLPEEVRQSGVVVNQASTSILLVANFVSEDPANPFSIETISGLLDQGLTDALRRVRGSETSPISATGNWRSVSGLTPTGWPPTSSPPPTWWPPSVPRTAWCRPAGWAGRPRPMASCSPSRCSCREGCAPARNSSG